MTLKLPSKDKNTRTALSLVISELELINQVLHFLVCCKLENKKNLVVLMHQKRTT